MGRRSLYSENHSPSEWFSLYKKTQETFFRLLRGDSLFRHDLDPVPVRVLDEVDAHAGVFKADAAHACGVKVVASNHDFDKTPDKEDIVGRLRKMQDLGADIPKIAVMPQSKLDVLTLLSATEEMNRLYADRPIITMSMAGTGVISRLCGEVFGSALTFGAAGKASAPGQMGVNDLNTVLNLLHKSL